MFNSSQPMDPQEAKLAREMQTTFNRAAAGQEKPGGSSGGKKAERPQATHDIEPSIQDKKAGAALDKSAGRERFEQIKQSLAARSQSRSHDLSR